MPANDNPDLADDPEADKKDVAEQGSNEVVDKEVDTEIDQEGGLGDEPINVGNDPLSK